MTLLCPEAPAQLVLDPQKTELKVGPAKRGCLLIAASPKPGLPLTLGSLKPVLTPQGLYISKCKISYQTK